MQVMVRPALLWSLPTYIKLPKDTSVTKQVKENPSLRMPPEIHTSGDAVELENCDEQFCISPHGGWEMLIMIQWWEWN